MSVLFLFFFPLSCLNTNLFCFPGNVNDEGANGSLP